ncbi:hypothetical protein D3C85_1440040 [compost metagenome]
MVRVDSPAGQADSQACQDFPVDRAGSRVDRGFRADRAADSRVDQGSLAGRDLDFHLQGQEQDQADTNHQPLRLHLKYRKSRLKHQVSLL